MKDIQSPIKDSQEDTRLLLQSNTLTTTKEQTIQDVSQKNKCIPFISKLSTEKKEELEIQKKKSENEKKNEIQDEDEIDKLISKISKNNVSQRTNRGKIIVEDKVKLDFDQDVKVDINKIKSNRFITNNNNNYNSTNNTINSAINSAKTVTTTDDNKDNHTISKYFTKNSGNNNKYNNNTYKSPYKTQSPIEIKTKSNEKSSYVTINTNAITNIPLKNQNMTKNNTSSNNSTSIGITTPNIVKINFTQIKRIIDISVVNSQSEITNSDLILCILEICINSIYYGFKYSNKSKIFWENLMKKNEFKNIFLNFKPETLKKYWIILSEIKDYEKAVDLININKDLIDRKELK